MQVVAGATTPRDHRPSCACDGTTQTEVVDLDTVKLDAFVTAVHNADSRRMDENSRRQARERTQPTHAANGLRLRRRR